MKEHFEVQKTENVKESIQGELNLKNQIAKRNDELVKQQEIELKKLTVRGYSYIFFSYAFLDFISSAALPYLFTTYLSSSQLFSSPLYLSFCYLLPSFLLLPYSLLQYLIKRICTCLLQFYSFLSILPFSYLILSLFIFSYVI